MINKEEFEKASFEEKQKFIKKILRLATHNAFTKADFLLLIKWQNAIIEKTKCCHSCKSHKYEDFKNCQTCDGNYSKWELAE